MAPQSQDTQFAVATGASSGIGFALAKVFAAEGFDLLIAAEDAETEFFERAEMEDTKVGAGAKDDPSEVARQGFYALMADEERVVAGAFMNRVQVAVGRVLPDNIQAEKHREMAEPGTAQRTTDE